jgi:hypothetical protein
LSSIPLLEESSIAWTKLSRTVSQNSSTSESPASMIRVESANGFKEISVNTGNIVSATTGSFVHSKMIGSSYWCCE